MKSNRPSEAKLTVDRSSTTGKEKRITAEIPDDLHRRAKAYCGVEGMTLRELLIELLEEKLRK